MADTPRTEETRSPASGKTKRERPSNARWLVETLVVLIAVVALFFVLHTFVFQTFSIPSGSMEPTLMIGDRIVVDKLSYHLHSVGRSDIVVFSRPADEDCGGAPVSDLVKRVIGLPGETISLSGGKVYINGKVLAEPWLPTSVQDSTTPGPSLKPYSLHQPFKIPAGEVFVMGDNRGNSCDSRYWGPIHESTIVGKVDLRIWPLRNLHWF